MRLLGGQGTLKVGAFGLSDGLAFGEGDLPAQDGADRPASELHPLERGVILSREEPFGRYRIGLVHVHYREIRVGSYRDGALARGEAVGAGGVRGDEVHDPLEGEAASGALGEHERVDEGGAAEARQRLQEVTLFVLLRAAGVIGADPVYLTANYPPPERVHVALSPYRRVDLAALVVVALVGEREMVQRSLQARVEVRLLPLELERRLERLLALEVQ